MSFAVTALVAPGIRIRNPATVSKTFPDFFGVLERLRA
jgi:5-enolpyruvylshikimate-3-phosphate synthase